MTNTLRISTPKQLRDLLKICDFFSTTLDFSTVCIDPLPIEIHLDGSGRVRGISDYHGQRLSRYIGKDGSVVYKKLK